MNNSDNTVVVTGCSSGIGYDTALTLAKLGFKVIATVRQLEHTNVFLDQANIHTVILDLASEASVTQAAQQIMALSQGRLYALFNNAAYGQPGAVEDLSRATLTAQFEANVFGTHQLTCLLLPELLQQARAHIIQNSSILGFIGMPMRGAYVASKFALEGLSDTLRMELSETNVQVSIIEPGPIATRFRENALHALEAHVDFSKSRHEQRYTAALARLKKQGRVSSHTLEPASVTAKVVHALTANKAKARYYVTRPTYIMAALTRLLPSLWLDKLLLRYAKSE